MANAIKTIWTKTNNDRTVDLAYDGFNCLVIVNGKQVAKSRPVSLKAADQKRLKVSSDVTMMIGPMMLREDDAKDVRAAMAKADAEIKASKTADLPGLAIAREAIERWADYHYQMSLMMETGVRPG